MNQKWENTVYFKSSAKMKELPDNSVDVVITSPPYFNIKDYYMDGKQENIVDAPNFQDMGNIDSFDVYIDALLKVWKECYRVLKPNGKLCINVPLMPMLKKEMSTHYNRQIFDIQSAIQNSILKKTEFFLFNGFIYME